MSTEQPRDQILQAAGPVFAEKGFQGATVREICRAAGVNLAAVNYYFRDKRGLYLAVVEHAQRQVAVEVPLPSWPDGATPDDRLRGFVRMLINRMMGVERAPWTARLMLREVFQPTEACRQLVECHFRPHFDFLLEILADILPKDTPQHVHRQVGFSIVGQCVYYRLASEVVSMLVPEDELRENFRASQLADHITDFSLAALGHTALGSTPVSATVPKEPETACDDGDH